LLSEKGRTGKAGSWFMGPRPTAQKPRGTFRRLVLQERSPSNFNLALTPSKYLTARQRQVGGFFGWLQVSGKQGRSSGKARRQRAPNAGPSSAALRNIAPGSALK